MPIFTYVFDKKHPIIGVSVREERLRQRGDIPFLEHYLKVKYGGKSQKKA